ncbi:glycoside hydrolase family 99-like domain-containing protein [Azorhizobium caulinodans]|nr:glycoside hydrolase family 99-like domain-containing protein [Azorhizobium caulinodans]
MALRDFIRRLRYGASDACFALFPFVVERKREAAAAKEMRRRAAGKRDPAWRPPAPPVVPPKADGLGIVAFYSDLPSDTAARIEAARPQFVRHVQPVLPLLPLSASVEEEVALATAHGIDTFCFWLRADGELPAALRAILATPDLAIGIAIFFEGPLPAVRADVLDALADPRALRIDGRPMLGASGGGGDQWQAAAAARLGGPLFLVEPFAANADLSAGFSAAVQIPPRDLAPLPTPRRIESVSRAFVGPVDEFMFVADLAQHRARQATVPLFPGICAGHDSTPGQGADARIMVSPDLGDDYARWLTEVLAIARARPVAGASLVFINAWNDWLNGSHLLPDARYGHALLRATASTCAPYAGAIGARRPAAAPVTPRPVRTGSLASVVHGYYEDLLPGLIAGLDPAHLFVTTPPEKAEAVRAVLARAAPAARLRVVENRGRDVRPFLSLLPELEAEGYDLVLKVHTKRSPHQGKEGSDWLQRLSGPLLKLARSERLAPVFEAHPQMGLLGAAGHVLDGALYAGSAGNAAWMRRLAAELGTGAPLTSPYVAGTMFVARLGIFAPLRGASELLDLFDTDMGLKDGTLAHAFERFFGVLAAEAGLSVGEVAADGHVEPVAEVVNGSYAFARSTTEEELDRLRRLGAAR